MNVINSDEIYNQVLEIVNADLITYKQYLHKAVCKTGPCGDKNDYSNDLCCAPFEWCIHASDALHKLPKHPNCDCYYEDVQTKPVGSISNRQPAPDVWLKLYGKLPDYYITKDDAEKIYGWDSSKNTLAGKAPGKMIGDEVFENDEHRLPKKEGRTWKYCDIDYQSGRRNSLRLFYSNDGLMFHSDDHGKHNFYWVK